MPNTSKEKYPGQRGKEKRELYKRFRHPDIEELYKRKFFSLFKNECFKCKAIGEKLDIDHHIPMALDGHLVPGNLVALCKRCNNSKRDSSPEVFYTSEELENLKILLEAQKEIFDFKWDWDFYNRDQKGYFLHVGVAPEIVDRIFSDPDYSYYIAPASERISFKIDLAEILSGFQDSQNEEK